jgi:Protein of unknown function (DUF1499)
MDACPPGSQNCIRTTWEAPRGANRQRLVQDLQKTLNAYPQQGQNDVDKGGWTIAENDLQSSGSARVEYKSGVGPFAIMLNFGKPFVDDLRIQIASDNKQVFVRSSSRIGQSDLGVNKKRLDYLTKEIRKLGWTAFEARY